MKFARGDVVRCVLETQGFTLGEKYILIEVGGLADSTWTMDPGNWVKALDDDGILSMWHNPGFFRRIGD